MYRYKTDFPPSHPYMDDVKIHSLYSDIPAEAHVSIANADVARLLSIGERN